MCFSGSSVGLKSFYLFCLHSTLPLVLMQLLGGGYTVILAGKLIQLKIILFYLDINNSDEFWHPVGCSTLQMMVSAKTRGSVRPGNVSKSVML